MQKKYIFYKPYGSSFTKFLNGSLGVGVFSNDDILHRINLDFISNNKSKLNWNNICKHKKISEEFIDNHPVWAHIDIAGVAFDKTEMTQLKAATGYGVRLLTEWISNL
jgi:hypothetical protein